MQVHACILIMTVCNLSFLITVKPVYSSRPRETETGLYKKVAAIDKFLSMLFLSKESI